MRPIVFGYMRLATGDHPSENETIERELAVHATHEGFELGRLFVERLGSDEESAYFTMIDALRTTDVNHVIVPSLWHFARLPGLQTAMRDHIEREIGAHLWVIQSKIAQPRSAAS
ncbi:recombinase family protein [Streptomyces sp. NPDC055099]